MIKEYSIKNLHCAGCAAKMEEAFSKIEGIKSASIDLAIAKLRLAGEHHNYKLEDLNTIASNIEFGTEIFAYQEQRDEDQEKDYTLYKIIASATLFAFGLIFENENPIFLGIFFALPYFLCGYGVLRQAGYSIIRKDFFNEYTLMAGATIAAVCIGELPEAVGVMLFYCLGEYLQEKASIKSRKSIRALLAAKPSVAHLVQNMQTIDKKPEELSIGDVIIVKPGEKIPLDATVMSGTSNLDLSSLTGESLPISVQKDSKVFAGTINLDTSLTLRVTALYQDSAIAKILESVENAAGNKAPTERFITSFAKYYTPAVVLISFLVAVIPPVLGLGTFQDFIYRALVLLVISCPCALIISIPLGYFSGIGAASRQGILVKGGQVFDALKDIQNIAFDKTGTLTEGKFSIQEIIPAHGISQETLLDYACLAEMNSTHPIARSIVTSNPNFKASQQVETKEIAGQGIIATYQVETNGKTIGETIYAGNAKLLESHNFQDFQLNQSLGTIVYLAKDNQYLGAITVGDKIKEDTKEALSLLRSYPIYNLVMLTGDNEKTAAIVATELGLNNYYAELLPQDKLTALEKIEPKHTTLFVGDGLNDAPVLASAKVSVAMGGLGSELAIEVADAVILNDSPKKIYTLLTIAQKTRKIIWQNIFIALGTKGLIMCFGVAGLSGLWEAVFADVGVALIAVLNSTRAAK